MLEKVEGSLKKKIHYYYNLRKLMNGFIDESTGLTDLNKELSQKLENSRESLEQKFED